MSALRDGAIVFVPTASSDGGTNISGIRYIPLVRHWQPQRRLLFLMSCIPRYLITGSVEVP